MKLAIDVRSLCANEPSGVGHYVQEILRAWPKSDHDVILFSSGRARPRLPQEILAHKNVRATHRHAPNKFINLRIALGQISLERLVGESIDVAWFPNTGFLPKTNARTIITVHDLAFHFFKDTYTRKHHLRYKATKAIPSIQKASALIAISNSTAMDIQTLNPDGPVHTILHGLDHHSFHDRRLPQDLTILQRLGITTPYILSLATCEPRKNLESLVEAFDEVANSHRSIKLVIVGGHGWKRKSFDKVLSQAKHRDRINVIGFVPDAARPALLRNATCLCLPSRYEGFGMQVLEAIACGTPVVTSRNSSFMEVGGSAAIYTRAMNVSELTRVLQELLNNKTLYNYYADLGMERAKTSSWSASAKDTLKILENYY